MGNKTKNKEQYINTPIWFIKATSNKDYPCYLTPFQREIYWLIYGLAIKKSYCFAGNDYFTKIFNVTEKHISNTISHLKSIGLIQIENIKGQRRIKTPLINNDNVLVMWDEKYCYAMKNYGFEIIEWNENEIEEEETSRKILAM